MKDSKDCTDEKAFEQWLEKGCKHRHHPRNTAQANNVIYCLGIIGAAVFFIGKATSFWMGVLGILKALVWPAILVYEAFNFLIK